MFARLAAGRGTVFVLGLAVGLTVGMLLSGAWPHVPLHATATDGFENFSIATGAVDDQVEAIYFLDFLTGDLKAAVINPQVGKFLSFFQYNILTDFGGQQIKNPKFLMVTGAADMPRGRQNFQFANSIVYVAEATSGQVASYVIPWNSATQAQRKGQTGQFVLLDKKPFRSALIRD